MSKFKNQQIKRLCWLVGSTTQSSTYVWGISKIKSIDPAAWAYLKQIGTKKWAIFKDEEHRRWGNLTTNVAESLNNVLGVARMLPIRALIDHTFDYTRGHFVKHYRDANTWTSPLARKMWQVYQIRERNSIAHTVLVYDIREGVYTVSSNERNQAGEYVYTVSFGAKNCTCGKWQNQRLPCSHAIAVCGHRGVDASSLPSKRYTTRTWKNQYNAALIPLRDVHYWGDVDWMIQGDSSRFVTHRGRRRTRRYRNEMDENSNTITRQPRQPGRCRICNGLGHNRKTCPEN